MTAALAHNGGRTQVNFNAIQAGGSFPFLNVVKACSHWTYTSAPNANAVVDPALLDANGYPTSIQAGGYYGTCLIPTQLARPGNYVVRWTATGGTSTVRNLGTLIDGSYSTTGTSGRAVYFNASVVSTLAGVVSMSGGYVNSYAIMHEDDEAAWDAGEVFGVKFKQRLIEGNFGVLRFLNWGFFNTSRVTTWATRKPVSYVSYHSSEFRPSLYAGMTTNSGNNYSLTIPGGIVHSSDNTTWTAGQAPKDKDTLIVFFNADAIKSGTCSLNVGSGAVNILNHYGNALSFHINYYPVAVNGVATLVYDALLNGWIKHGGDDSGEGARGINNGCPIEIMLQLCAEVGAHIYTSAPHLACTPMTDYHTQLATYLRDNAPSWMVPRYEGPNELWNGIFHATGYATTIAEAYGWGTDFHNWYGRALSTIGQNISTVYGGDTTKYQILCGVQTIKGANPGDLAGCDPRLNSTKYLLQTPQSGYTATAAKNYVTHLACAQYFAMSDYTQAAETTAAGLYAGATFSGSISGTTLTTASPQGTIAIGMTIRAMGVAGNEVMPGTMITAGSGTSWTVSNSQTVATCPMAGGMDLGVVTSYLATCDSGAGNFTLSKCNDYYIAWKAWAATFGINGMCGYEGGLSTDYTGGGVSSVDRLRAAAKNHHDLYYFEKQNMDNFIAAGGRFPSCYRFSGSIINGYSPDAWSVLEDVYQYPTPPRWEAARLFNHNQRRFRIAT